MSKITIVEGNSNDKDNVRVIMVKGERGYGIVSIEKTATDGLTDTYTITFDDDTTTTFTVTNGEMTKETTVNVYDTVAEMVADTTIRVDTCCKTLGYYSVNDGGGATYKITDTESSTEYQEELDNELFATLIIEDNKIKLEQWGAYGNGVDDDSIILQRAINYCQGKGIELILSKKYAISSQINISLPIILKGVYDDASTILLTNENACINLFNENNTNNLVYNLRWYNLKIDGNNIATSCVKGNTSQSYFEKVFFINSTNGFEINTGSIIWFKDCYFYYLTNALKTHRINAINLINCNCWDNDNIIYAEGTSESNGRITALYINNSWIEGFNNIITRNSYVDSIRVYMEQTSVIGPIPTRRTNNYIYKSNEELLATLSINIDIRQCDFIFTGSGQTDGIIVLDNNNDSHINLNDTRITKPNTIPYYINTDNLTINKYQTQITCNRGGDSSVSDNTKCVFTNSTSGYYGDTSFPNGLVIGNIQPSTNASLKEGQLIMNNTNHILSLFSNNAWKKILDNSNFRTSLAYGESISTSGNEVTLSESINNFRLILLQIRSGLNVTDTKIVDLSTMNKVISNGNKTDIGDTDRTITITKNSDTSLTVQTTGGSSWVIDVYGLIRV